MKRVRDRETNKKRNQLMACCMAGMLSICVTMAPSPFAPVMVVHAEEPVTIENNPVSVSIETIAENQKMIENNGEVRKNEGTVETNNGTIKVNDGNVTTNNGTIKENDGNVTTNNGTIVGNSGNVTTNNKFINYNYESGSITTNEGGIGDNDGSVTTNMEFIESNFGSITTNMGGIDSNIGSITTNQGKISVNSGKVKTNKGEIEFNNLIIDENTGTVKNNMSWGDDVGIVNNYIGGTVEYNNSVVHNFGGTVNNDKGEVHYYFTVDIAAANVTATYGDGFTNNQGKNWLEEVSGEGVITLKPADGYEIKNIATGEGITAAVKNADGSWTVTVTGIKGGFEDIDSSVVASVIGEVVIPAVEPEPAVVPVFAAYPAFTGAPVSVVITSVGGTQVSGSAPNQAAADGPAVLGSVRGMNPDENINTFDIVFYADTYADVKAVCGYDRVMLWLHWTEFGMEEGRMARFEKDGRSWIVQYPKDEASSAK